MDAVNTTKTLTDAERIDRLRLIRSDNVGPRTFRSLLDHCGSAREALVRLPDLARRGGSSRSLRICNEQDARSELAACKTLGISLLAPEQAGYPPRLEHDPEKCAAVFRKDHAQSKAYSAMTIQPNPIAL